MADETETEFVARTFPNASPALQQAAAAKLAANNSNDIAKRSLEIVAAAGDLLNDDERVEVIGRIYDIDTNARVDAIGPKTKGNLHRILIDYSGPTRVDLVSSLITEGTYETIKFTPVEYRSVTATAFIRYMGEREIENSSSYELNLARAEAESTSTSKERLFELMDEERYLEVFAFQNPVLEAADLKAIYWDNGYGIHTPYMAFNPNCPPEIADELAEANSFLDGRRINASAEYLRARTEDPNAIGIGPLLENPNQSPEYLASLLHKDEIIEIPTYLRDVLNNPATPVDAVVKKLEEMWAADATAFDITDGAQHPDLPLSVRTGIYDLMLRGSDGINWTALNRLAIDDPLILRLQPNGPLVPPDEVKTTVLDAFARNNKITPVDIESLQSGGGRKAAWTFTSPELAATTPHRAEQLVLDTAKAVFHGAALPDATLGWSDLPSIDDIPESMPRGVDLYRTLEIKGYTTTIVDTPRQFKALSSTLQDKIGAYRTPGAANRFVTGLITHESGTLYSAVWEVKNGQLDVMQVAAWDQSDPTSAHSYKWSDHPSDPGLKAAAETAQVWNNAMGIGLS